MKRLRRVILFTLICALMSLQLNSFAEINREDYKTDYDYYTALAKEIVKEDDYDTLEEYNVALEEETENQQRIAEENAAANEPEVPVVGENTDSEQHNDTEKEALSYYPKTVLDDIEEQNEKYNVLRDLGIMDYGEAPDSSIPVTR